MTPPRDTPEGVLADLAQVLLVLLFLYPDDLDIMVPRTWLAQWHRDVEAVLAQLRTA